MKKNVQNLINHYMNDGFDIVDIELTNYRTIGINFTNNSVIYKENCLCVEGNGVSASIEYKVIKSVVI